MDASNLYTIKTRTKMLDLETTMTQTPDDSPPSITVSTTIWPLQLTHITKDQRLELSSNGFHSELVFLLTTSQITTASQQSSESNTATTTVSSEELKLIKDDEIIKNYGKQTINFILKFGEIILFKHMQNLTI